MPANGCAPVPPIAESKKRVFLLLYQIL